MRRRISVVSALLALGMLTATSFTSVAPASAVTIGPTTTCNNALGNGGAVCETTVVNTITPTGGTAMVTVRECTGSAGVPDASCTTTTTALTQPVTQVTQCDGSINGGGGQLRCSVHVTNNFVGGTSAPDTLSVNPCVGSADTGSTMTCDPFPATTTGATVTQCNGTSNGGGASLTCTASGNQSSAHSVLIDQCNGSSNGGGTLTVCSAHMENNNAAAAPTPAEATPAPAASTPAGSTPTGSTPTGSTPTGTTPRSMVPQTGMPTTSVPDRARTSVVAGFVLVAIAAGLVGASASRPSVAGPPDRPRADAGALHPGRGHVQHGTWPLPSGGLPRDVVV